MRVRELSDYKVGWTDGYTPWSPLDLLLDALDSKFSEEGTDRRRAVMESMVQFFVEHRVEYATQGGEVLFSMPEAAFYKHVHRYNRHPFDDAFRERRRQHREWEEYHRRELAEDRDLGD